MEEKSSSTGPLVAQSSQVDQEASSKVRNIPVETSRPARLSRGGRFKARDSKDRARGKRAREKSGDTVPRGEDVTQPLSRFEVDRYPTKMTEKELELVRDMYQVPDYLEFRLPGPTDQLTHPSPRHLANYRDYFWKGLWLPLHPFFKEALLNLDVSLPQLNSNTVQSLVALWVLYRVNNFPSLPFEEFQPSMR